MFCSILNNICDRIMFTEMKKQQRTKVEYTVAQRTHQGTDRKTGGIRFPAAFLVTFFPQKK